KSFKMTKLLLIVASVSLLAPLSCRTRPGRVAIGIALTVDNHAAVETAAKEPPARNDYDRSHCGPPVTSAIHNVRSVSFLCRVGLSGLSMSSLVSGFGVPYLAAVSLATGRAWVDEIVTESGWVQVATPFFSSSRFMVALTE